MVFLALILAGSELRHPSPSPREPTRSRCKAPGATKYTIAIVTHNLQQAKRVADMTAFLYVDTSGGGRTGYLVEYGQTEQIFEDPKQKYTKDYLRGEFS